MVKLCTIVTGTPPPHPNHVRYVQYQLFQARGGQLFLTRRLASNCAYTRLRGLLEVLLSVFCVINQYVLLRSMAGFIFAWLPHPLPTTHGTVHVYYYMGFFQARRGERFCTRRLASN